MRHDVRAGGQLEIEHPDRCREALDVGVLDVAAVLPQVRGDPVGAGLLGTASAASTGSGSSVRRASRRVATWSMLMYSRMRRHCSALRGRLISHANIRSARDL